MLTWQKKRCSLLQSGGASTEDWLLSLRTAASAGSMDFGPCSASTTAACARKRSSVARWPTAESSPSRTNSKGFRFRPPRFSEATVRVCASAAPPLLQRGIGTPSEEHTLSLGPVALLQHPNKSSIQKVAVGHIHTKSTTESCKARRHVSSNASQRFMSLA